MVAAAIISREESSKRAEPPVRGLIRIQKPPPRPLQKQPSTERIPHLREIHPPDIENVPLRKGNVYSSRNILKTCRKRRGLFPLDWGGECEGKYALRNEQSGAAEPRSDSLKEDLITANFILVAEERSVDKSPTTRDSLAGSYRDVGRLIGRRTRHS